MSTCIPSTLDAKSKQDGAIQDDEELLIIPLKSLQLVQRQLDELNSTLKLLRNEAVNTVQEEYRYRSDNQLDVTVVKMNTGAPTKQIQDEGSQPKIILEDELYVKWQLYYYGAEQRAAALGLLQQGLLTNIKCNKVQPKAVCDFSELEDGSSNWCCFRIEFHSQDSIGFKRTMRDLVLMQENLGISTIQP